MLDFTDQHVIVTGGTRGLGGAFTRAFVQRGAYVTAIWVSGEDKAAALKNELGDRLTLVQLDVADAPAVDKFWDNLQRPVDVLVNNAGIRKDAIVGLMPYEEWRRVLAVNLDGTYHMTKRAVQAMSRRKYGRIINVTSPAAHRGSLGASNYAASKAGQEALAKSVALEVASRNITVNCLEPGYADTDLIAGVPEEKKADWLKKIPLGRFAKPEEVANACLFLASREAGYVTGSTLKVAGGL